MYILIISCNRLTLNVSIIVPQLFIYVSDYQTELDFSSEVVVSITTKDYASENSWTLGNCTSNETYDNYRTYNTSCRLKHGMYTLKCFDSYGDGWLGGFIEINGKQYCADFNQKISEHQVQIQLSGMMPRLCFNVFRKIYYSKDTT